MSGPLLRVEFDGEVWEYQTVDELLAKAELLEKSAQADWLIHQVSPTDGPEMARRVESALSCVAAHYDVALAELEREAAEGQRGSGL